MCTRLFYPPKVAIPIIQASWEIAVWSFASSFDFFFDILTVYAELPQAVLKAYQWDELPVSQFLDTQNVKGPDFQSNSDTLKYIPNTSVAVMLALLFLRCQVPVCFTCVLLQLVFGLCHDFAWHFPPGWWRLYFASSFNSVCRLCSVSDTSCKMKCMAATQLE